MREFLQAIKIFSRYGVRMRARDEEKTPKKVKMKGGLGWIRGLRGQEQDMSSLAL